MPRRIILPPKGTNGSDHRRTDVSIWKRLDLWIVPCMLAVGYHVWTWRDPGVFTILILSIVVVAWTLIFHRNHLADDGKRIPAVVLYPIGIQLCKITVSSKTEIEENGFESASVIIKANIVPGIFLFRDVVLDCVVAEIVHSYKVESRAFLRIFGETQNLGTQSSGKPVAKLIDIFPDVNMTYMECLFVRSQINEYLRNS